MRTLDRPIEELESFLVDPQNLSKFLHVGNDQPTEAREKLKCFLCKCKNLNVFTWRHEDIVGTDPKVSCHHLKS